MRKRNFLLACAAFILAACISVSGTISAHPEEGDNENTPAHSALISGPVDEPLPWSGHPQVEALKLQYHTPVLMAAYRANLPDPILAEAYNISHAADMLAGTVVEAGEIFSQNKRLGPYTKKRGFADGPMYAGTRIVPSEGGGVCKIASILYNVVVLSNNQVVERHPHSMTVPYVPPGQDATVAYGAYDFRFKNTSGGPILIWAKSVDGTLYIAFYGNQKPPRITWRHETLSRSKFWTQKRYNPSLPPGTEKETLPGQEGITVRSWLTIETPDKKVVLKDLGLDSYSAGPRVIEFNPVVKTAN